MSKENPIHDTYEEVREENQDVDSKIHELAVTNPVMSLRYSMFEFFKAKLNVIGGQSKLKTEVEASLLADLMSGKLTTTQKMALLSELSGKEIMATNSILEVLKPDRAGHSPFLDPNIDKQEREEQKDFGNLTKEDNESLQTLSQFAQILQQAKAETAKEKQDVEDAEVNYGNEESSIDDLSDID